MPHSPEAVHEHGNVTRVLQVAVIDHERRERILGRQSHRAAGQDTSHAKGSRVTAPVTQSTVRAYRESGRRSVGSTPTPYTGNDFRIADTTPPGDSF
jgi:hypothetical protein